MLLEGYVDQLIVEVVGGHGRGKGIILWGMGLIEVRFLLFV